MDIVAAVSAIPGVRPVSGLEDAWTWSPNPRFVFVGALSADGDRLFRMNTRDAFDETFVAAVLAFAREHSAALLSDHRPFVPVPGFSQPGWGFDTVGGVQPSVSNHHEREHQELRDVAHTVFPAFHHEFSGAETADEAFTRFKRMIDPANIKREPSPFLKMRFDNTKTQGGSIGDQRGFTDLGTLRRELTLLEGAPGSFVEFENRAQETWSVHWDGDWVVSSSEGEQRFGLSDLVTWAERQVLR